MEFDIEKLINEGMAKSGVNKNKVISIMTSGLKHKTDEFEVYRELYKEIHEGVLNDDCCKKLVSMLYQGDEEGEKWTLAQTNDAAERINVDFHKSGFTEHEFWAAMHIVYYDCATPLKKSGIMPDTSAWARMAEFYFTADDEENDRIVDYFFYKLEKSM